MHKVSTVLWYNTFRWVLHNTEKLEALKSKPLLEELVHFLPRVLLALLPVVELGDLFFENLFYALLEHPFLARCQKRRQEEVHQPLLLRCLDTVKKKKNRNNN